MTKPIAISYIRFSHPRQKLGDSARRQIAKAKKYCEEHSLELDETIQDDGKSGYSGEHVGENGQLGLLLANIERGTVPRGSTIIVEAFDRLSRMDPTVATAQFLNIINKGISIVTIIDGELYNYENTNKSQGKLSDSISLMRAANLESKNKAKRLQDAWDEKRVQAATKLKPISKSAPGWIDLIEGEYVVNEERAKPIRKIFELSAAGHGTNYITKYLNENGYPVTTTRLNISKLEGWQPSTVKYMLRQVSVLGIYQPHRVVEKARDDGKGKARARKPIGDPIHGYFKPIITQELFDRARQGVTARTRVGAGKPQADVANLLSGVSKCGECDGAMVFERKGLGGKNHYLKCYNNKRGAPDGSRCTNRSNYVYKPLEDSVVEVLRTVLFGVQQTSDPAMPLVERLADAQARARQLRERAERGSRQLLDEDDVPESLMAMIRKYEKDAKVLDAQAIELQDQITRMRANQPSVSGYVKAQRVIKAADTRDPKARRELKTALSTVLDMIICGEEHSSVAIAGGYTISFLVSKEGHVSGLMYHNGTGTSVYGDGPKAGQSFETPDVITQMIWQRKVKAADMLQRITTYIDNSGN
jgi:DNA invertase Pin-like site-specific DNA recombinase